MEMFTEVVGMPAPPKGADYVADVVIDQVFAEIWTWPSLTRKERRWIAITCACASGAPFAMETHLGAALRSGDISIEKLREFVIMFAAYAGHRRPRRARHRERAARSVTYDITPIGTVESALVERADAPRQGSEGAPEAWIVAPLEAIAGTPVIDIKPDL